MKRDGGWLKAFWVRASFLFLAVCMVSSALSVIPAYAFSEGLAWFRFPLFAMATAFRLGTDRRLLYAMLVWRPHWRRYGILVNVEIFAVLAILLSSPSIQHRYVDKFLAQLPIGAHSPYYRAIAAGPEAAKDSLIIGQGPATFRDLCPKIIGVSSEFDCHNHPHNFYSQLISETGVIDLVTGSLMIVSIIWAAFAGWRKNRDSVVAATAFVAPFGLFFPIQSTGDFFGQWNNIFMWSAIALALAAARTLTAEQRK